MFRLAIVFLMIGAAVTDVSAQPGKSIQPQCDIADLTNRRQVYEALAERAVEAVLRASLATWETDPKLKDWVVADATFSLGAGDVGRPMGSGVAGLRKLVTTMAATSYLFPEWGFMDSPAEPCSLQKVTVEFRNAKTRSKVEFAFVDGRIQSASGWEGGFREGPLPLSL